MTADPYNRTVRAFFDAPAHAGDVDGGVTHYVEDQGVRIRLSAAVRDGHVEALCHRVWGCPHLIAAVEAGCRQLEGKSAASLLKFGIGGLMTELEVPAEKTGRMLVLEDAVRSLGAAIDRQIVAGHVADNQVANNWVADKQTDSQD